jgi:uncharacterized LabA/DUF88 family protein
MHEASKADGLQAAERADLYRIFFYDCPPLTKKMHFPVSKRSINLADTPEAKFRLAVHEALRQERKVALRLGRLSDFSMWKIKEATTKRLVENGIQQPLTDEDFEIDTKQKGVDMRLGLDVAAMAFKRQVNQIVLVAADEDFVPAAKLARREGIDVVLDTMGGTPSRELQIHSDGMRNCKMPLPNNKSIFSAMT